MKRRALKTGLALMCAMVAVATMVLLPNQAPSTGSVWGFSIPGSGRRTEHREDGLVVNADFYVSTDGSDANDGSLAAPFASLARARDAVRTLDKRGKTGVTVALRAGDYRVSGLVFTHEDSGTVDCPVTYCAYGDGEVVLNGGLALSPADFGDVRDESMLARLTKDAQERVVCADLKAFGLGSEDWGQINAIGAYQTASRYSENRTGALYCELFYNDAAMTLARYPNEGWLNTGKVLEQGEGLERAGDRVYRNKNWENTLDPKSDTYKIDRSLAKRISSWKSLADVWMFGYWMYDWADASTPVGAFDAKKCALTTKYVSLYGAKKDAPYYFFNVFEELDAPGEFYLERDTGMLYVYRGEDFENARLNLSLTTDAIVRAEGTSYLTLRGLTVQGTRGDALIFEGDGNTVENCLIKNVSGWALRMTGLRNAARGNEITGTGQGGIYLDGGDRGTLTPGENTAENNSVHAWSRIYQTYQSAVSLNGVGNRCANNEMYDAPHQAVNYSGNNHLIEYNSIHDVCLLSDDAGAIYSGRHWDWYGTVIRYNSIYNLGSGEHKPCGIYLDDALSGQEVYGNFLFHVPGIALHLGGGRDLIVKNNIIIDAGTAISYDARAREGATKATSPWAEHWGAGGDVWKWLEASPWQTDVWRAAYPAYARFSADFAEIDDARFGANPAFSDVSCNLIFDGDTKIGNIDNSVYAYSAVRDNGVFPLKRAVDIFADAENGDYSVRDAAGLGFAFERLPVEMMGR